MKDHEVESRIEQKLREKRMKHLIIFNIKELKSEGYKDVKSEGYKDVKKYDWDETLKTLNQVCTFDKSEIQCIYRIGIEQDNKIRPIVVGLKLAIRRDEIVALACLNGINNIRECLTAKQLLATLARQPLPKEYKPRRMPTKPRSGSALDLGDSEQYRIEQEMREKIKNRLILFNIKELKSNDANVKKYDWDETLKTLNKVCTFDESEIQFIHRIGIKQDNKIRPIVVGLKLAIRRDEIVVLARLKRNKNIKEDLTPKQQLERKAKFMEESSKRKLQFTDGTNQLILFNIEESMSKEPNEIQIYEKKNMFKILNKVCTFPSSEIVFIRRIGKKHNNNPRPIMVELKSKSRRDEIASLARQMGYNIGKNRTPDQLAKIRALALEKLKRAEYKNYEYNMAKSVSVKWKRAHNTKRVKQSFPPLGVITKYHRESELRWKRKIAGEEKAEKKGLEKRAMLKLITERDVMPSSVSKRKLNPANDDDFISMSRFEEKKFVMDIPLNFPVNQEASSRLIFYCHSF
jgi:hypothetical protein